jgi:hypothetical protein
MRETRVRAILRLCEKVRSCHESEKNIGKLSLWEGVAGLPNVFTRWIPRKIDGVVPFIADLDREMWAQVLEMDVEEIYGDSLIYLEFELRKKLFAFENFDDDYPITKNVTIWHGVGFLQTLLGLDQEPAGNGHEPWVGKRHIVREKNDLAKIKVPDFYRSGLMPEIHRMYEEIRGVLEGDFDVVFPEWDFGCYGIALSLRGTENLSIDMIEDSEFVHELMKLIYHSKVRYSEERAKFLGADATPLYMPNDDVSIPVISPAAYEEYVFPYEVETSNYHGGIDYWHSCGRIDPILHFIKQIPRLKMIHVSYANDFEKSVRTIGGDNIIEFVLNPIDDVLKASPESMRKKLDVIKNMCQGLEYTVRADAFQKLTNLKDDIGKIKTWIHFCRDALHA